MKRVLQTISLVLILVLFGAMALGSASSESKPKDITASNADKQSSSAVETAAAPINTVTIEEQVILDAEGIVITAKEFVHDKIWGDGVKLLIENNSEKDVGVALDALIVNNYMISDLFSANVAAGKKSNNTMYLLSSELEASGIENIGQIEMYFRLYDSDSYQTFYTAEVTTIQTSAFEEMDCVPNDAGTELFNSNGIRIVGKSVDENSFWGAGILLYVENNSGRNIGISCEDLSVNGFMLTSLFSCQVYDGKMAIDDISLLSTQLEENGIESVNDVELKFHIYDCDSYSTILDTDVISFSAK